MLQILGKKYKAKMKTIENLSYEGCKNWQMVFSIKSCTIKAEMSPLLINLKEENKREKEKGGEGREKEK